MRGTTESSPGLSGCFLHGGDQRDETETAKNLGSRRPGGSEIGSLDGDA